ncbi:hypothetical protein GGI15_001704 [Coemansia interrupta]|uniref:Uracil phosphoribosyltransferase n=1 Tax=Coemansia interrupta TaxID=1126814 RepID=A0A9W8LM84_9FUNG|nr:hypothetical protein GGI15_001704 [Coemansia interrupta]
MPSSVEYLKSLAAVRQRASAVYSLAQAGRLQHFRLDESKLDAVCDYVVELITRDYGELSVVPSHGRWRSYSVSVAGRQRDLVAEMVAEWRAAGVEPRECARRVVDLFVVSVLVDAGAGSRWAYEDAEVGRVQRTEGLGMAALRMFQRGAFSSSPSVPCQADSRALAGLADHALLEGFQVSPENPLLGAENRAELLRRLGAALDQGEEFFAPPADLPGALPRPGFVLDYLERRREAEGRVVVGDLWRAIVVGLAPVWPASRTQLNGVPLGDVWPCAALLASSDDPSDALVPFHKLSQWLTWSLLEVVVRLGGFEVEGTELLTGLPEYRNGGLFVDMGVLTLRPEDRERGLGHPEARGVPLFDGGDSVIVEWRALTVALLDRVAEGVSARCCGENGVVPGMLLARVLEGGTWKAGREIAARLRPETKDPPINIVSDGTLF